MPGKYDDQQHLIEDNLNKAYGGGGGATTDMLPELLAESTKLKPEEDRVFFKGGQGDASMRDREKERDRDRERERERPASNIPIKTSLNRDDSPRGGKSYDRDDLYDDVRRERDSGGDDRVGEDITPKDERLTEEELMLQKLEMLRKLGELAQAGVTISQNYTLKSDLKMMKYEWELHRSIRAKQNAINWMSSMSLNAIYGIEMLNDRYNPFDLKLTGWSEQMNADVDSYYDVFGELYDKYSHPTKGMAPELKLLLMLSGSALKFHLSNSILNSSPNLNDALDKDPELRSRLRREATIGKMKEDSIKQSVALNNKMSKEHALAAQKAADLKMIKEKEMEYINAQKVMEEKKAQMEQLRKGFRDMTPTGGVSEGPVLERPVVSQELNSILNDREKVNASLSVQQGQLQMQQQQLKQEVMRRKELEEQVVRMQVEMGQMKKGGEYYKEKIHRLSELEKLGSSDNRSARSTKSGFSQSVVSINPDIDTIFRTKKEAMEDLAKDKEREKEKKKLAKQAEMSERIVSIGTVDDVNNDDGTFISLGSKRSNKSGGSKEGAKGVKNVGGVTAAKKKNKGINI
ncbi:MAG: hypothetical protein Hyperionvirus19_2 [Hyperionvirus sp.]|uniref:Uncharacterized protein n=1 Tax=Hyperionvirus sp. TaxID=2487770 RepID=A0A3G5AAA5_9VIRU|nr:MAG: hypothetical protein Hyperionvirus19_2 [Hyperionvirus sp.]